MSIQTVKDLAAFDQLVKDSSKADKVVFADFYATWCPPCKTIAPKFEEFSKKYNDNVVFVKIDVDEQKEIAETYNAENLPTFLALIAVPNPELEEGDEATEENPAEIIAVINMIEGADEQEITEFLEQCAAGDFKGDKKQEFLAAMLAADSDFDSDEDAEDEDEDAEEEDEDAEESEESEEESGNKAKRSKTA